MSLDIGYGSLIDDYQREEADPGPPVLNSLTSTEEGCDDLDQRVENDSRCMPALSTLLARHIADVSANNSSVAVVRDANLKMYHVMSVKQSLFEDLAEHSYQFSCSC